MSDDFVDEIKTAVLVEVVRKITIVEGDILVVRAENPADLEALADVIVQVHQKHVVIVEEGSIDILRDVSEEEMKEFGWKRIVESKD